MRMPLRRVAVTGESMRPVLRDGDWILVRGLPDGSALRAGQIVLCERPDRPGLLLVKRAIRRTGAGWWVQGDNSPASDDSRLFGPVPDRLVLGRVLGRYWPEPRALCRA